MSETKEETIIKAEKYEVVIFDTLNAIQNDSYMSLLNKDTMVTRDVWKDFGVDIYSFMADCKGLGIEMCLVLGYEGSGKSYGIKYLNPLTTMWLHADKKPITFKGGRQAYSRERMNYSEPSSYKDVLNKIKLANDNRIDNTKPLILFILGHIEDYKSEDSITRQRLKVLGKMATKMNIEGSVAHCYYTVVTVVGDKTTYKLKTQNTGYNTGRSPEEMFKETTIDNNFQLIVDAIKNY